jgi:predicted amidohydrolase
VKALSWMVLSAALSWAADPRPQTAAGPEGWEKGAARAEIAPQFRYQAGGGRSGKGALVIQTGAQAGLAGYWRRRFVVEGGQYYRFSAWRRQVNVAYPQQSGPVTIAWLDAEGQRALDDRPLVENYLKGFEARAPVEHPQDKNVTPDGWTLVTGTYQAPSTARQAVVELHLRWAAKAVVEWSDVELVRVPEPPKRIVRLAAVHYRPEAGQTAREKREQFAPFIAEAARRGADLVVLPETLTYYRSGRSMAACAEPIPGPSTEYFAGLAKKHNLYIVAGLLELKGPLVYNVAVLVTPEGRLGGKYRKATLPDSEIEAGLTPGDDFPVFETRFGRLGMMVCYDGFFPEVARELTRRGAEVIAWPVWGCNPDLARARAAENHVYLVSSTYEDVSSNWMLSAIWDHTGATRAVAKEWGTVAIAEVDLNAITRWRSLGDFRSKLQRHTPMMRPSLIFR